GPLPAARRILVPFFDGLTGEIGAIACLIDREIPTIEIDDSALPGRPWSAQPAATDREVVATSLANILSVAVYLLQKAVFAHAQRGARLKSSRAARAPEPRRWVATGVMLLATATVVQKAIRLLKILAVGGRAWVVALRSGVSRTLLLEGKATFNVL